MLALRWLLLGSLLTMAGSLRAGQPWVEMIGSGAPQGSRGTITFLLHPEGRNIAGAVFYLDISAADDGNIALPGGGIESSEGTVPPGWDEPYITRWQYDVPDGHVWYAFISVCDRGTTMDPIVFTMSLKQKAGGLRNTRIRLLPYDDELYFGSHLATEDLETIGLGETYANFVNGISRRMASVQAGTDAVRNGVTAGILNGTRVVASVSGTKLHLTDAVGLQDIPGFEGGRELGAPVDGRAAIAQDIVAIGTRSGRAFVYDMSGKTLANLSFGDGSSVTSAPAIIKGGAEPDIYWTVHTPEGPVLAHTRGSQEDRLSVGGKMARIASSPAILGGRIVFGTSEALWTVGIDPASGTLAPMSVSPLIDGMICDTSPALSPSGIATVGSASAVVYRLNVLTGGAPKIIKDVPWSAAPLSDPFIADGGRTVLFGGHDGNVYVISDDAVGRVIHVGGAPLNSPVKIGDDIFVGDDRGRLTRIGPTGVAEETMDLGIPFGKAIVATGADSSIDRLLVNTTLGEVHSIPLR